VKANINKIRFAFTISIPQSHPKGAKFMLANILFTLIPCLITSRWSHGIQDHHSAWEDSLSARLGPFWLERNHAFVLDHADVYVGLYLPILRRSNGRWQWNRLNLGFRACRGDEQIRQPGLDVRWIRPFAGTNASQRGTENEIPF
jgi:hypothetical protein